MKRMLTALWAALSSRALPPLVLGFFLLLYIGIAFFTDETLTALIVLTGKNLLLAAIFALLPLSSASRIVVEATNYLKRRRILTGSAHSPDSALYDETVDLVPHREFAELEDRLRAEGYRTRKRDNLLAAWHGISLVPSRIILLAATFCLFAGILTSLVSRTVYRQAITEGKAFPALSGKSSAVESIVLKKSAGPILSKELAIRISGPGGGAIKELGVYPPTLYEGAFAYLRYLGISLDYRFSAPDLPGGYESSGSFPIYPPGKEASAPIPGSTYKIAISLAKPDDGMDPYMTGNMIFYCKLLKGSDLVFSGNIPRGGELVRDGYRLAFPDARRTVITDFVVDYGVLLIWCAALLFVLGSVMWLLVRLFRPRREMLFICELDKISACSRAEGRERKHAGVFHEALDYLEAGKTVRQSVGDIDAV